NNAEQKQSRTAKAWSASEQSAAGGASTDAKEQLAAANRVYERKFGFIFIVCAAGKATEEILALLNQRLRNSSSVEIRVAAEEQRKITRVRLEKLLTK
ncbi:MAG TPA: 2-oxo-4-hydroxy-4-carboxy-5-ureidoimidazoline decarboxylase, partial [Candidatus Acidoferrales bacterium]|nr:2-oxo-4-hydroxy-4-carboxy-5-ureidoimidazoline decarboxylase [Candidatus Acidoferrales bacterium]